MAAAVLLLLVTVLCTDYTKCPINATMDTPRITYSPTELQSLRPNCRRITGLSDQTMSLLKDLGILKFRAFRLAAIQLAVTANKAKNLEKVGALVWTAVNDGAKVVALPECFNSPYGTQYFVQYAEKIPGESTNLLSRLAVETKTFIIGGSIPEEEDGKYYNTCTVYDPEGNLVAKHRKMHLFDIDVPGKITFKESEVLEPGNAFTTFDTPFCKVGIGICYDMRFPELAQIYAKLGCKLIVYPGAFNMTTGPAHWEAIQRGRAIDNQLYVATVSPARDLEATYNAWGHSMVVSPWGDVITEAQDKEEIIAADINPHRVDEIRQQIPVSRQRRTDMYQVTPKE